MTVIDQSASAMERFAADSYSQQVLRERISGPATTPLHHAEEDQHIQAADATGPRGRAKATVDHT